MYIFFFFFGYFFFFLLIHLILRILLLKISTNKYPVLDSKGSNKPPKHSTATNFSTLIIVRHIDGLDLLTHICFINALYETRTAGAYGPLVLAPAEGMGALRAPCQVWVMTFFLIHFCYTFFNFFLKLYLLFF